jgi:hypothetical protein
VRDVAKGLMDAASYAKNYYTFMSAGYVADRLKEVLDVCGTRLDLSAGDLAQERVRLRKVGVPNHFIEPSLKKKMARLERALREGTAKFQGFVYDRMSDDLYKAIQRLTGGTDLQEGYARLTEMKSDALVLNLSAFEKAMDKYSFENRHEMDKKLSLNGEFNCLKALMRIDEELGYTSAADKLETVLEFGSQGLPKDLRKKVERMQQALRDSETEPSKVRLAVWVSGQGQYLELWQFAMGLVHVMRKLSVHVMRKLSVDELCKMLQDEPDEMTKALAAFFRVFEQYKASHTREFSEPITREEEELLISGVQELDNALGYE